MATKVRLGEIDADVVLKEIKNVHLSVHPPTGRVRIAAPSRMSLDTIRVFAISKVPWIRQQQKKFREQERETPREYIDRESHYVWGRRYLLKLVEAAGSPFVELSHRKLILKTRPGSSRAKKEALLDAWYREQVKAAASPLIAKWERLMQVKVQRLFVQRMKTKWGSCNRSSATIRLNTDLAKKPRVCLEYIVVHELTHLLERTHNRRFLAFMHQFLPKWQASREILNSLPVRNENWSY
jgi:predicted metal-dependent hydrolase